MLDTTRAKVVSILKDAVIECTDVMYDEGVPFIDATEVMAKAHIEMAVVHAVSLAKLRGHLPTASEFKELAGLVFGSVKTKLVQ